MTLLWQGAWQDAWLAVWQLPAPIGVSGVAWVGVTLGVFLVLHRFAQRYRDGALAASILNPIFTTSLAMAVLLWVSRTPLASYMNGGAWLLFALTPALILLAVPLYEAWGDIRAARRATLGTLAVGFVASLGSLWLLANLIDLPVLLQKAMWLKSVTSGMAIVVAPEIDASGTLAAGFVIVTGLIGVLLAPVVFRLGTITSPAAQGLALGIGAHATGTVVMLQARSPGAAFAVLGMGANAMLTALLLPWIVGWLGV